MKKSEICKLDERQIGQYLSINSAAAWTAYGMLSAAIVVQIALGGGFKQIIGEAVSLIALCVVMCVGYIRCGIWDKSQSFSKKKNIAISLVAALAIGGAGGVNSYRKYHKLAGSLAAVAFIAIFTFLLCIVAIYICWKVYEKRLQKLENSEQETE